MIVGVTSRGPPANSVHSTAEAESRPKSAHRYNVAEQQQIYKSEIERIWKAQFDSLSRRDEPQLTPEEEKGEVKEVKKPLQLQRQPSIRPFSPVMSPPMAGPSRPPSPAFSRGSSVDKDHDLNLGPDGSRNVLRIKRLVRFNLDRIIYIMAPVLMFYFYLDKRGVGNRDHPRSCCDPCVCTRSPTARRRSYSGR